jgi:hypothetical protein
MNLTRREAVKMLSGLAGAALVLAETACESVTDTLELIVAATNAAVDIGFPQYAALLNPYFAAVTKFVDQASAELASTDSTAQKYAAIAGYAAAIAEPNLSGVASEVVTRVAAIAPLIAQLVDQLKGLNAEMIVYPGGANAFFAAHKRVKPPTVKQLAKVKQKNAALKARLK